ncbi:NAD(P)/FAD-dependent oxidoreductase [Roseomonas sp. AR75]|uniref:NAD(P)/FAD-dependent oxidoreductase n=1 Tax=Roseomonas sp. AR75 TaxID=2562311 RepID=UPI0010BF706F|nr:FAD/NAD(P)-binding oxidoreductase [Roseomonas sp. AR75]
MTTSRIAGAPFARRAFMLGGAALAGLAAGGGRPRAAVATRARIVILGAGAAGLAMASRLAARLDGAEITLLDRRREHLYQPGFTLVAAGLRTPDYVISTTAEYVARGVTLVEERGAEIDPVAKVVTTDAGRRLPYDFLVLATGLTLDYAAIEGMDVARIGQDGLGSVYAGPAQAEATWRAMSAFADRGGTAIFGRPETEMKCAGAPLKYAFLTDDTLRRRGNRTRAELIYNAQTTSLFSVPIVAEKVRMLFGERGIKVNHSHVLKAIDPARRIATFETAQGRKEFGYDFINVIPPMRAPEVVRNSPLRWQSGPWAGDGWAEVERHTLRHVRFPEVFAVGDIAGVPKGKTAASVKWQVPVAADHLVATIEGKQSDSRYDGYTSCPLITRVGRAMLVEFDYENNLTPSFPGVIAPLEELWISWIMKEVGLKPTYLAMLRGRA